jgi:uncharacterized protein YbjT (DUF2867 family)
MVATADIGRMAADLLQETWSGSRVVEFEGPWRVTPDEIAATLADLLGRPVRMAAVPRDNWESLFKSQGMQNPTPRIRMLDGFNQGWIEFGNVKPALEKALSLSKPYYEPWYYTSANLKRFLKQIAKFSLSSSRRAYENKSR